MSLVYNIKESLRVGYNYFKSLQDRDNLKGVIHNNEVLNALDKPKEFLDSKTEGAIAVGTKEYKKVLDSYLPLSQVKKYSK